MSTDPGTISAKAASQARRVLVVDPNAATTKMLAEFLRTLVVNCQVLGAQTEEQALLCLDSFNPQLIFVELTGRGIDGLGFTRRLRRSYLASREAPVVIMTAEPTAAAIMGARDAGAHEFLRRPFTLGDLKKRIDAITLRPRDWVEAVHYVGPDRRRFNSADYKGPRKREAEGASPVGQRIAQAIKIIQAAAGAVSTDPKQAHRALRAQARILAQIAAGNEALKPLESAARALEAYLQGHAALGLQQDQLTRFAAQLASTQSKADATRAA